MSSACKACNDTIDERNLSPYNEYCQVNVV